MNPALFRSNPLNALVCKVIGHKWKTLMATDHASVCMVCLRCRENGWRL